MKKDSVLGFREKDSGKHWQLGYPQDWKYTITRSKLVPVVSLEELPELLADYLDWLEARKGQTYKITEKDLNTPKRIICAKNFLKELAAKKECEKK